LFQLLNIGSIGLEPLHALMFGRQDTLWKRLHIFGNFSMTSPPPMTADLKIRVTRIINKGFWI